MKPPSDDLMAKVSPAGSLFEAIKYTHTQGRKIKNLYPKNEALVNRGVATMQKAKIAYARAKNPVLYFYDLIRELLA